ncbi:MAG: hypothetical protein ACTSV3_06425 [Candidatus Thorarchaeota archaeon]|nr:MAG: hypothetical protein DRP09_08525 [Candidatus Thorarchaeota archaeon]RLI59604.1 MAG: hypothetical protein DRO87_02485 [Candidatus Thorarchaeota archaeon]
MENLTCEKTARVTTREQNIISHEKAYVRVEPGVLWAYIHDNGERVGIAFLGPARFAVDAIAETDEGAIGESVTGALGGVQLYFGESNLDKVSRPAETSDTNTSGYEDIRALIDDLNSVLEECCRESQIDKVHLDDPDKEYMLIGRDTNQERIILALSRDGGLILTHDKRVYVVKKDNIVSLSDEGVIVADKHGERVVLRSDGIDSLRILERIEPIVTHSIGSVMRGLGALKSIRSMKYGAGRLAGAADNVDDFDWKDE